MGVGAKGDGEGGSGKEGTSRRKSGVDYGGGWFERSNGDERISSDALSRGLGAASEGSMALKEPKVSN